MKNLNELITRMFGDSGKVTIENGDIIIEGVRMNEEILKGFAEKEQFTITMKEEDLPPISGDWIQGKWLPDLRVDSITLDMVEKQGKKISNPHAREQGRKSEVYLNAEELNVLDYLKGAELTLRGRGPAAALLDCMTDLEKFTLEYRFLFCMQWFRVNNSEAFHVLLD